MQEIKKKKKVQPNRNEKEAAKYGEHSRKLEKKKRRKKGDKREVKL